MVSHRLSSIQIKSYKTLYRRWFHIGGQVIQIKSYKTLYRRWFHIGCQVYRYNLIRLYTEDGFT